MKLSKRAPSAVVTVLVALAAALAIAACGGSSGASTAKNASAPATAQNASSTTSSTTTTGGSTATGGSSGFAAQRAKLQSCLKKHGVTLPQRPAGGFQGRPRAAGPPTGTTPSGTPPTSAGTSPGTGTTPRRFGPGASGHFGDGGFPGGSNSKLAKAFKACGGSFGGGRFSGGRGYGRYGRTPRIPAAKLNKFISCMKQNGVNLPKPKASSGNGSLFPSSVRKNPKFNSALKSCESILRSVFQRPTGPSRGGSSTTPTTTSTSTSANA